jgi:micrococcal nuclease
MRRRTLLAALLGTILFPTLLLAADFTGRVVGISDGDTISVLHDGKAEKIRLNGIDCPEKRQAFGQRAKQFTSKLAFGKEVTVKTFGHDKYRRTIGDVVLADGRILNHELVKAGLAWWYERYSKDINSQKSSGSGTAGEARVMGVPGSRCTVGMAASAVRQ